MSNNRQGRPGFRGPTFNVVPPEGLIPPGAQIIVPPIEAEVVDLRGFKVPGKPVATLGDLLHYKLILEARDGVPQAVEIMDAFKMRIVDLEGKQMWPMEVEKTATLPPETVQSVQETPQDNVEGTR